MKKIRTTLFLLLAALISTSCANGSPDVTPDSTSDAGTTAEPESTAISDDLPDIDFEGREFRILTCDYLLDDYLAEEENGSLMNDTIYRRNRKVEDRFGVSISTFSAGDFGTTTTTAKSSILSGEDEFDLVINHMIDNSNLAVSGLFADFNSIDYVSPEKPWWNSSAYENLSIDGYVWLMVGDISPYFLRYNYVVYFNKRLTDEYSIDEDALYSDAMAGKWTIDRYSELTKDIWNDLNGNNEADENDLYGLTAQVSSYVTPFIYSFGETTVKKDENDIPKLAMDAEKFSAITEKVYKLIYEQQGTLPSNNWTLHSDTFIDGRAVFMNGVLAHSIEYFTDMKDDYGILPYPKWDEAQEGYYTMADGCAPLIAVPKTVKDTDFVGIITEAMAYESYQSVTPVLYETALKVRGARDEKSLAVIDLAVRCGVVDFGFVFGDYKMMGFTLYELMPNKNPNFASYYASNKDKWEARIESIVDTALGEGAE